MHGRQRLPGGDREHLGTPGSSRGGIGGSRFLLLLPLPLPPSRELSRGLAFLPLPLSPGGIGGSLPPSPSRGARGQGPESRPAKSRKLEVNFTNRWGKSVNKGQSDGAKKRWEARRETMGLWAKSVKEARQELGLEGFVSCGGETKEGNDLYLCVQAKVFKQDVLAAEAMV